jgi:signal transduction histidine kinase
MKVVFINLIKNSIDAGARHINVTAKNATIPNWYSDEQCPAIEIIIEDDGIGIPEENFSTVFRPFETANKKGGMGLGLTVNQEILNQHCGEIRILWSKVGQGTSISMILPINPPAFPG